MVNDMNNWMNKSIIILWCLLFVSSISGMIYFKMNQTIVLSDNTTNNIGTISESMNGDKLTTLLCSENYINKNEIQIPIDSNIRAEKIIIENHPLDKELWIYIKDLTKDFYNSIEIKGDIDYLENAFIEEDKNGILIKLCFNRILEFYTTLEENGIVLQFEPMIQEHENIIIIR